MFSPYLFLIVAIIPVLVLVMRKYYITDQSRMTSVTEGRVVRAEQRVVVDPNERRTETEVVVRYAVAGHELELKRLFPGERAAHYPADKKVAVRYNPATPAMADFANAVDLSS